MSPPDKLQIKDRYNQLGGELYDTRYTEEQTEKYEQLFAYLGRGKTLDNGCGTGLFLPKLSEYSVGLDLSSMLLKEARSRTGNHQSLVQGDSENLPFRENIFDQLVSVTVIQNVPFPEKMVSESARVTIPTGPIVISSLKRVYKEEEYRNLFKDNAIKLVKVFSTEKINDWIAVIKKI